MYVLIVIFTSEFTFELCLQLPILPLQMLVYTPKGNIPVVGNYLHQCGLHLEHPLPPYDAPRIANYHYYNPHNPAPGGHNSMLQINRNHYPMTNQSRWTTPAVSGKSVEVQRSQVDELFKSLKSGDELEETEPCACQMFIRTFSTLTNFIAPDVATKLYPHQKKALTFLLEREREKPGSDGKFSSLWQARTSSMSKQTSWYHVVTQSEVFKQPVEARGSILADDVSPFTTSSAQPCQLNDTQMGLGKTITCVSLIAATLPSARAFASTPLEKVQPPGRPPDAPGAHQFAGSVWGMPEPQDLSGMSAKNKAKAQRLQEKLEADYARVTRIKAKSRATLIICPLSTVANWEDQFREHWKGEVQVVGGAGGCVPAPAQFQPQSSSSQMTLLGDVKPCSRTPGRIREGTLLRVYIYHGNARRPDPAFLADFDAVITTYATLASEFSKQNRSVATAEPEDDDDGGSSDGIAETDEYGNQVVRLSRPKKHGSKRKIPSSFLGNGAPTEASSALQSVHWFRVVLDEAQ